MNPIDKLRDDEFIHLVQRAVALPDAPTAWVEAAVKLWPARRAESRMAQAFAVAEAAGRLVHAALGFDSWAQPAMAAGVRSSRSDTRHLLFNAQGRDVDLRIRGSAGAWTLMGQILGPDETGEVELVADEPTNATDALHAAALDDLGEFRIDGVPAGVYRLTLKVGNDIVALPPIDIGDRP